MLVERAVVLELWVDGADVVEPMYGVVLKRLRLVAQEVFDHLLF